MMEYPTWKKKPRSTQFLHFMKSYSLEPPPLEEPVNSTSPKPVNNYFILNYIITNIFRIHL